VRPGAFDVSLCIVEPAFIEKQPRQAVMSQKQFIVPVEGGCNTESYLEMVDSLICVALGTMYMAKNTVRFADMSLLAFV
jgi:hypothetical protein